MKVNDKENKKTDNRPIIGNILAVVVLVLALSALIIVFSSGVDFRCACDYGICDDVKIVGNGGVNVNFLMVQIENFTETSEFCNTKGYQSGQVSGSRIYCGGEGRYEYFRIMTDFVGYLYEKYK